MSVELWRRKLFYFIYFVNTIIPTSKETFWFNTVLFILIRIFKDPFGMWNSRMPI